MAQLINLDKLPDVVGNKFGPFAHQLIDLHGDEISSVFIYGSATGANYVPRVSDINSVIVFQNLSFQTFEKSLKIVDQGIRQKIAAPLLITEDYIRQSTDVFPMEFLDMKENHVVVYGRDVLEGLEIRTEHLRLFCEEQIKGKLIRIRQAYLEIGLKKKGVEALLKESLDALTPVFRNLLRIKGHQPPPVEKTEVFRLLSESFCIDGQLLTDIFKDKSNDEKIEGREVKEYFARYVDQIAKLASEVDRLT